MSRRSKLRDYRLLFTLVCVALCILVPAVALGGSVGLQQADSPSDQHEDINAPFGVEGSSEIRLAPLEPPYTTWLPMIMRGPVSYRLGFGAITASVAAFPEIASLKAGWYMDWNVRRQPARPNFMEFVQTIRVHQKLTCPLWSINAHDRSQCPYAWPYDYVINPGYAEIEAALRANPRSLWLIGNEIDRRDWALRDNAGNVTGTDGQDEILPETYATAYHDLYTFIKGIDPTAQVAIGGIIQATPLRLEYLTRIWNAYQQQYGTPMPVDVWNVHNFILQERLCCHGASIPPGITALDGALYLDTQHVDMGIFDQQIRAFRQWMKQRGEQDKPLIVSEYGVLYSHIEQADTAQEVQGFMISTFDYFLGPDSRDCDLGYPADDCRMVQRWAWYSLEDIGYWSGFNPHAALFDPTTRRITSTGVQFRTYSLANMPRLAK